VTNFAGVCLIESESGGDSSKVTEHPNLSASYGIFQINSKEWCRKQRRGGECGARCEGKSFLLVQLNERNFMN
jgi:C-type lysozyme/alpha-lactalbumin family